MSLIYPNIVPENNLRLPDALTIKHGPAALLARFIIESDKVLRAAGIHLRLRTDFDTLAEINEEQVRAGTWYPLVDMFNPRLTDVSAENAFWLTGEDDKGEIVCTQAARIYYWPDTNFAEQAVAMVYGRDEGQPCIITAEAAKTVTGIVQCNGATWIRPDYRRRGISALLPRICRAYAPSRWPIDWVIAIIKAAHFDNKIAYGWGVSHFSSSLWFPERDYGELVLAYTPREDVFAELETYLATDLSDSSGAKFAARSVPSFLAQEVINTSPDGVRQGSSKRS
jgi:GNAT superfamily N-acetyltransferase